MTDFTASWNDPLGGVHTTSLTLVDTDPAFKDADCSGEVTAVSLQDAAAEGAFGARTDQVVKGFTGRPRMAVLNGIALFHPAAHLGEAVTVRSAGGFGTGI